MTKKRQADSQKKKEPTIWELVLQLRKEEIAAELGLLEKAESVGWANLTAKEAGRIGGRLGGRLGDPVSPRLIADARERLEQWRQKQDDESKETARDRI